MNVVGNVLWVLFGGFAMGVEYLLSGIAMCLTIIGIPFGIQIFKLGVFALLPFGKTTQQTPGSGCLNTVMNIIWFFVGGLWIALSHLVLGVLLCITIVGIPFGRQHFKMVAIALSPFGRDIVSVD